MDFNRQIISLDFKFFGNFTDRWTFYWLLTTKISMSVRTTNLCKFDILICHKKYELKKKLFGVCEDKTRIYRNVNKAEYVPSLIPFSCDKKYFFKL